jgi:NodT family efflux transporter outer membrane factor (OMF) lipoprotein
MHRIHGWWVGALVALAMAADTPASAQVNAWEPAAATSDLAPMRTGHAPTAATSGFWEVLADTTLARLLDEAGRRSFDIRAAMARVEGAGASRLHAALDLLPSVTATAGFTRRRFSSSSFPGAGPGALPDQNVWESGLNASWEVDVFGRVRSGVRARSALVGSAEEDVRATEIAIAAELARSYFHLRGAQDQLAVALRNAENQRRTLGLTQARLDAGRGTDLDAERARAQLSSTLSAVPLLEARIAETQYRVAVLVGRPPREVAEELAVARPLPPLPDEVPSVATSEVLGARPDLASAEEAVTASRALVGSVRADYLPRLSLVAGAGYTASAVGAFGNNGTFNYAVGPVISWPAFDIGRVKARVDEARAFEMEARAQRDHAALRALEELDGATVRYETARARLTHLEDAAGASERAATLAARRYEGGVGDFLQVLDAERTLLVVQDELARGRTTAAEAYVALYEARAGLWGAS